MATLLGSFLRLPSRRCTATLALLLVLIVPLGCMGLQLGGGRDGLVQEGEVTVQPNQEVDIYFATAYGGVPDIEMYWPRRCEIVEVTDNHFRVRNSSGAAHKLAWNAMGMPSQQPSRPMRPAALPQPAGFPEGPTIGEAQAPANVPLVTVGPPQ